MALPVDTKVLRRSTAEAVLPDPDILRKHRTSDVKIGAPEALESPNQPK